MIGTEINIMEFQLNYTKSHVERHISFLDMLLTWRPFENRTDEKATQGELKAILELCLNMNEGNLLLPKTNIASFCRFHPC